MAITLTYNGTALELHPDLLWQDEFSWTPVVQSVERTVTGAMVIDYGTRIAGRPITLLPDGGDSAWMPLSTINTLNAWAAVPGREMVLNIRGQDYDVVFRHIDGALEISPVIHYNSHDVADFYVATVRLLTI